MSKKIVLVCSFGGHFVQAQRLAPSFKGHNISVISTHKDLQYSDDIFVTHSLIDCNFRSPFRVLICAAKAFYLMLKLRPKVVVSTGAAPGCIYCFCCKIIGSKIIWIDSIANSKKLSLSGRLIRLVSNSVFSQWENVATDYNVKFIGKVI